MWFGYDWLFEAGFVAKLIYSVPKSLAVQYSEPETDVRLHSCGLSSFPACVSEETSECPDAFTQKQSYNGDFRHGWRPKDTDPERSSFHAAPGTNVQTEHSTTPGGAIHSRCEAGGASGGCRTGNESGPGRLDSLLQPYPQEVFAFLVLSSSNSILREKLKSEMSVE